MLACLAGMYFYCWLLGLGPFVTNRLSLALVRLEMQYSTLTYLKAFASSIEVSQCKIRLIIFHEENDRRRLETT